MNAPSYSTTTPTADEGVATQILKLYERLSGKRGNWEAHWQEIAERFWPNHSALFQGRAQGSDGVKHNREVFDSTAIIALDRFSAILDSLLTPRNSQWHQLKADNPYVAKDRESTLWFEEATRLLFRARYAPTAGFCGQNQLGWKSLGAFGSGCLFTDKLRNSPLGPKTKGFRYKQVHQSEVYFIENHQGIVDGALRRFPMTCRQIMKAWTDKAPPCVVEKAKENPDHEFFIIHCVMPREDFDPGRGDIKGMYFGGWYVLVQEKYLLEEGGFRTFPYAIPRYEQVPGEAYGRSPAMAVLSTNKTLNEMKKTVLKQGHRTVDPVLLAHDDGIIDTFSLRPGAVNAGGVSADGRALVQALPVGNIAIGKELMDDERADIKDAFLVALFQILVENPRMTATEVIERTREKGFLLAPVLGRIQDEALGSQIERELDLAMEMGLLPPLPRALIEAQGEYRVIFDSPLTRAMRAEEASGMMRTFETALNYANVSQDPSVLDHFNLDVIIPQLAEIHGVPPSWMRSMDDVSKLRESRSESQQQEQNIASAPGAAALIKAKAVADKQAVN